MPLEEILRAELADLAAYVPASPAGVRVRLDANEAPAPSPQIRDAVAPASDGAGPPIQDAIGRPAR